MGVELLILIVCILFSAFFSASETSYTSISRIKIGHLVERRVPGAKLAKKLKDNPSKLISVILIGNNIVNIGASVLGTSVILKFFEARGDANTGVILAIATGLLTFFILEFGEIIPKTSAIRNVESLVVIFAWPLFIISIILTPVAWLLSLIAKPFILFFGGKVPENGPFLTEDELRFMIAASEKEGVIEKEEKEMISSIFDFGDTNVKEVMTPRPDIKAIEDSIPMDDLVRIVRDTGHSRIPVFEGNLDNIVGVIYAKDLLGCLTSDSLREYMRPVIFIPEGKKIDELLHQMQSNRTHIAVVVDEYGVTSGIITMEDIIEEIVGEIHDEFERTDKNLEKVAENVFLIDGKMSVDDANRELGINLPVGDEYDTIAGLIISTLGKVPAVGDKVLFADCEASVERVLRRRITRVKIMKKQTQNNDNMVGG